MIFTASSKFWPRVNKKHLNFGTCPHRKLTQTVIGAGTRKPKGWESQEELKGFFSQFINLVQWDLQAVTHLQQRCRSI